MEWSVNREIKFRAWDGHRMVEFDLQELYDEDLGTPDDYLTGSDYLSGTVMQYTGLKDTLGRDIYDGDILLYVDDTDSPHPMEEIHCVEWVNHSWSILLRYLQDEDEWDKAYRATEWEIVGNKYENPELLSE